MERDHIPGGVPVPTLLAIWEVAVVVHFDAGGKAALLQRGLGVRSDSCICLLPWQQHTSTNKLRRIVHVHVFIPMFILHIIGCGWEALSQASSFILSCSVFSIWGGLKLRAMIE